jgi:hypothetical protein
MTVHAAELEDRARSAGGTADFGDHPSMMHPRSYRRSRI